MFEFINIIKFFAALLITNSHFSEIYPENLSFLSFGGLLGDILFFYASGFCLCNIKKSFVDWYSRRIARIYPAVWIITIICRCLNIYHNKGFTLVDYYVYPTYYHFIASILLLYIFYYIILKTSFLRNNLKYIIMMISVGYLGYYFLSFNYRGQGFDLVEATHIRCFFFIMMLLGAYHRMNVENIEKSKNKNYYLIGWVVALACYFGKELFYKKFDVFQFVGQALLFVFMYCLSKWLIINEKKIKSFKNTFVMKVVNVVSAITLEVYIVQYLYINTCYKLAFPLNFIVTVIGIFGTAYVLSKLDNGIYKGYCKISDNIKDLVKGKKIDGSST